jgi:DNA polymerase-3 subunit epsilon
MNVLFFDTETTGLPRKDPTTGEVEQPRITQLGFILERNGVDALVVDTLIRPDNWPIYTGVCKEGIPESGTGISRKSSEITGITQDMCEADGIPIADAVELFVIAAENADMIVCHNTAFDLKVIRGEYGRLRPDVSDRLVLCNKPTFCTMKTATPICRIGKKDGRTSYKWPKLIEAMKFFFDEELENAHSAIVDIKATRRVFHKLIELGAFDDQFTYSANAGYLPHDIIAQMDALRG